VVLNPQSQHNIWWDDASPNKPLSQASFNRERQIAMDWIGGSPDVFVQDGFINWEHKVRHH
jgi:hypothetical protein